MADEQHSVGTDAHAYAEDGVDRPNKRAVAWVIWIGVILGVVHGVKLYGVFTIPTLAMAGLMFIVVLGLYSAWVALRPASPTDT